MNFFLEKIRNKLGNNLLHEMQMMGVSTVVSSLLSMFSVKCFGSITSDFRKYFESRKYYDIFVIISQIQTIPNFGNHSELSESLGNFRNHSEISEFFLHMAGYNSIHVFGDVIIEKLVPIVSDLFLTRWFTLPQA